MAPDVLILSRDPAFGEALTRLLALALEVEAFSTDHEVEAEDYLADDSPVLVMESEGSPRDYAFLLRAWRIRPETPVVVCCPPANREAHRSFGPIAILDAPTAPAALVRGVRRGLLARPYIQETVGPPLGLPPVLPVDMAPVDVMHLLRRDPLTFNLWREASNPSFHRQGWGGLDIPAPTASYSLARSFLPRCDLSRANLTRMSLFGASLRESSGAFCGFSGADLREADLSGALLVAADLRDADLRGACLDEAELVACDLRGAEYDPHQLESANLVNCDVDPRPKTAPRTA